MSYPHMPEERELVARLVEKSDRLETAAKIREAWDAARVVALYVAGVTFGLWLFPTPITLPYLWAVAGFWGLFMLCRAILVRRSFRKRQRAREEVPRDPGPIV